MLWTRDVEVRGGGRLVGERCVESQFVAKGLLFAAVCKPVVHSDLGDQVRAQAGKLRGRHPPLMALCPEGGTAHCYMALLEKYKKMTTLP